MGFLFIESGFLWINEILWNLHLNQENKLWGTLRVKELMKHPTVAQSLLSDLSLPLQNTAKFWTLLWYICCVWNQHTVKLNLGRVLEWDSSTQTNKTMLVNLSYLVKAIDHIYSIWYLNSLDKRSTGLLQEESIKDTDTK